MVLEPSLNNTRYRTGRRFSFAIAVVVHALAALIQSAQVAITFFRFVGVLIQTCLKAARCEGARVSVYGSLEAN